MDSTAALSVVMDYSVDTPAFRSRSPLHIPFHSPERAACMLVPIRTLFAAPQ
jgi:hypothetical protein